MNWKDFGKKIFAKKEPEQYSPQREYIDRRHDNLQRQLSFYEKKREIPIMEAKIKQLEKEVFGQGIRVTDDVNILKAPNHFKSDPNHSMLNGHGFLGKSPRFKQSQTRFKKKSYNSGGMLR